MIHDLTNFHGAIIPPNSVVFPAPFNPNIGQALVYFPDGGEVRAGALIINTQRQLNFLDNFSWALGSHQLKMGIDYRRLRPTNGESTGWSVFPSTFSSLVAGTADSALLSAQGPFSVNIDNYSLYGQDMWKVTRKLTLTYGLRWEINTAPSGASGTPIYVTQGIFNSQPLSVVPGKLWRTTATNLGPRVGGAYQITTRVVARGGFGLFYDLGYGNVGVVGTDFPYSRYGYLSSPTLPFDLSNPAFRPPPFSTALTSLSFYLPAVDPHLELPFTMEWNAAIEGVLGSRQTLTLSYVGADGRRLLRQDELYPLAYQNVGTGTPIMAIHNLGYSHYNALQVQFQRQLSGGLQALVSYALAKASDLGSSDANGVFAANISEVVPPPLSPGDRDIRNTFSGAVSYEIPPLPGAGVGAAILRGLAVDGLLRITSQPPVNVTAVAYSQVIGYNLTQAEVVPGQPFWIRDATQPNGRALNPNAFTTPAVGSTGNFPRNGLRSGYSIDQTDIALRRRFNLTERVKLDLRAEYFNVFNHPMFGAPGNGLAPNGQWGAGPTASPGFGRVSPGYTTNFAMGQGGTRGGQDPLYSVGGPRSGQLTIKFTF